MKDNAIKTKEAARFLVGGGSAVAVDFITYQLFMRAGVAMDLAKGTSFVCGAAVGFVINKLWTFESKRFSVAEIARYVVLYACVACVNALVNAAALRVTGAELLGFFCATGVSAVLNFLGQKYLVFRK